MGIPMMQIRFSCNDTTRCKAKRQEQMFFDVSNGIEETNGSIAHDIVAVSAAKTDVWAGQNTGLATALQPFNTSRNTAAKRAVSPAQPFTV